MNKFLWKSKYSIPCCYYRLTPKKKTTHQSLFQDPVPVVSSLASLPFLPCCHHNKIKQKTTHQSLFQDLWLARLTRSFLEHLLMTPTSDENSAGEGTCLSSLCTGESSSNNAHGFKYTFGLGKK